MITLFRDPFFETVDRMFESTRDFNYPQTKINKNDSEYKITMSVPGLTKEDLKITTKDGLLKISFEKKEKEEKYLFTGGFSKVYTIPEDVKEKDIVGKVENGVLELVLPIDKKKTIERSISLN